MKNFEDIIQRMNSAEAELWKLVVNHGFISDKDIHFDKAVKKREPVMVSWSIVRNV